VSKRFLKLTRTAIRMLAPGHQIAEHGIVFRRLEAGDGVFEINVMVDRRRIHRIIGRESEGVTRAQAEAFIEQARTDARHGRLNLPTARKTPLTFSEAAERYVERQLEEGGKNIEAKRRQLRQHLIPSFGAKPLNALTSFDVERYKKQRLDASAAPATINRELAVLSHLLNKATEWKWISASPVRLRRFRERNGRIVYLTPDQCAALERAAMADQSPHIYPFIVIGLRTGMRRSEILSIRREHVNLDRSVIFIPRAKAGAREQPITRDLADFLRGHMESLPTGCEWLFPSVGSASGHLHDIRKGFRRTVARAGMNPDEVVRHTLRHTAITHLVQAGVDLPTVQRISGHKTLSMVARYAHQNGAHVQAAMDKLEARLSGAAEMITQELHKTPKKLADNRR
jgi:integrase